jgi:hypothetical protein
MKWNIEILNFKNVSLDDAKFLFSQAEKKLDDTVKVGDSVTNRSYTIISILVGLLIALSGYFFNSVITAGIKDGKTALSLIAICYLLVCLFVLLTNIFPKSYYTLGSQPKDLAINDFFVDEIDKDLRSVYLYVSEIENYQERIEGNFYKNNKRLFLLRNCLIAVYVLPIILSGIYFFVIS